MKEFDVKDWEAMDDFLWKDLLSQVGKLDRGFEKQQRLLNCKKSKIEIVEEVVSTQVTIKTKEDAILWIKRFKTIGLSRIDQDTLNQNLYPAFQSASVLEFMEIAALFRRYNFEPIRFLEYLSERFVNEKIQVGCTQDDAMEFDAQIARPKSLLSKTVQFIPPNDAIRKKLLLFFCTFFHKEKLKELEFWNSFGKVLLFKSFHNVALFVELIQDQGLKLTIDTYIYLSKYLPVVDMKKLLQELQLSGLLTWKLVLEYCKYNLSRKKPEMALDLYLFNTEKIEFNDDSLFVYQNLLLFACYERKREAVVELIHGAKKQRFDIPQEIVSKGIVTLCQSGLPDLAQLLFDEHRTLDPFSHDDIFAIAIGYVQLKLYTAAHQFAVCVLERRGAVGKRSRKIILKGLLAGNNIKRANEWLLDSLRFKDMELIHLFMEYYISNHQIDNAVALRQTAEMHGCRPNDTTYRILLTGMIKEGSIDAAIEILKTIKGSMPLLGDEVYAAFLEEYIRTVQWEPFEALWKALSRRPIVDLCAYHFVRYAALTNQLDRLDQLRLKLTAEKHPKTLQSLVLVYLRSHQPAKAEKCLKEMQMLGPTSDHAYARSHFVSYHARQGDLKKAKEYMEKYLLKFKPHSRIFIPLMRHGVKYGDSVRELRAYWKQMKSLRVPLDAAAYNAMVAALSELGEFNEANQYFFNFRKTGIPIPPEFYQTILVMYGKQGKIAEMEHLYEDLTKSLSSTLNSQTSLMLLNALMTGYTYGGVWRKVWVLWRRLRSVELKGVPQNPNLQIQSEIFNNIGMGITLRYFGINSITVCVILDALGLSKKLSKIRSVWKDILDSKFPIVLNNVTSLAEALIRCEQHEEAINIVLNLKRMYNMNPDFKLLRNTLSLIPSHLQPKVMKKYQQRYPELASKLSLDDIAVPTPPMVSKDTGIPIEEFRSKLIYRKGVWLLPPIKELTVD